MTAKIKPTKASAEAFEKAGKSAEKAAKIVKKATAKIDKAAKEQLKFNEVAGAAVKPKTQRKPRAPRGKTAAPELDGLAPGAQARVSRAITGRTQGVNLTATLYGVKVADLPEQMESVDVYDTGEKYAYHGLSRRNIACLNAVTRIQQLRREMR